MAVSAGLCRSLASPGECGHINYTRFHQSCQCSRYSTIVYVGLMVLIKGRHRLIGPLFQLAKWCICETNRQQLIILRCFVIYGYGEWGGVGLLALFMGRGVPLHSCHQCLSLYFRLWHSLIAQCSVPPALSKPDPVAICPSSKDIGSMCRVSAFLGDFWPPLTSFYILLNIGGGGLLLTIYHQVAGCNVWRILVVRGPTSDLSSNPR